MGQLVDDIWHADDQDAKTARGRFVRKDSAFRNWITPDGAPGPSGDGGFKAEAGRYHLYVSLACPWAHRTLILRRLKGLETMTSLSVVHYLMREDGWTFDDGPGVTGDPINGAAYLREVYTAADSGYTGRVTVPVLWDKATGTIVSNESAEIIRMLDSAFDGVGAVTGDYYPEALRGEIDVINALVYDSINNGVYKCGFATSQAAYDEAFDALFAALDEIEERLGRQRYLVGDRLTEADWRLLPTLLRFDPVYFGHFKCNRNRLADFPNLWNYTRELYQVPGVAETVNLFHIQHHYYGSHRSINPTGIVPAGPEIDFAAPHDRGRLPAAA